jgi:hypothetical protein
VAEIDVAQRIEEVLVRAARSRLGSESANVMFAAKRLRGVCVGGGRFKVRRT